MLVKRLFLTLLFCLVAWAALAFSREQDRHLASVMACAQKMQARHGGNLQAHFEACQETLP